MDDGFDILSYLMGMKSGGGGSGVTWNKFKKAVDAGTAAAKYPVGSQLWDVWAESANAQYNNPWDIVHYDAAGNGYLKMHYAYPTTFAFDEPEALCAFEGTEEPGEYYVLIKLDYGTGWKANDAIAFTLTAKPAAGDQLVISTATNNATDPTNVAWKVYAAGGTTVKQSGTTSNSTAGTKLGETSTSGTGYTNGRVNAPQRVVYGYGRWSQSAVRQYLNSAGMGWWLLQNIWDRPPAAAATLRGFMGGLDPAFLNIVDRGEVVTALNTAEGLADTTETTQDYFFLPSLQEMYITPQLANVEGVDWDYFKALAEEAGLSGKFATGGTYPELITYSLVNQSSPVSVRLRSATRGGTYNTWVVYTTGYVYGYSAAYAYRGCPACKIKKSA